MPLIHTVLFDLDGTFADTAPDLADALNKTLLANGRPALGFDKIRPVVSHGGKALIELGFGISETHPDFAPLREELLGYYQQDIARHTQLFPGIHELLTALATQGMRWGIVTNKPAWLTDPLLAALSLPSQPCAVVSGDTLRERKPHPAPLLHACAACDCPPHHTIYIGDAERDIVAGKRAGMLTLGALYGYIGEMDEPLLWQADGYIDHAGEIHAWISAYNADAAMNQNYAD